MRTLIAAVTALALSASLAVAQETKPAAPADNSISGKSKEGMPKAEDSGMTADPTAKPADGSLSTKSTEGMPKAEDSGMTANPTAKPMDGSLKEDPTKK